MVFGEVQSWQIGGFKSTARAMGTVGLLATILGYVAVIGIYAGIVLYAKQVL